MYLLKTFIFYVIHIHHFDKIKILIFHYLDNHLRQGSKLTILSFIHILFLNYMILHYALLHYIYLDQLKRNIVEI